MITHIAENNRFEWEENGIVSFISYYHNNEEIILNHSEVPYEHRGKGIGKQLVEASFSYIQEHNIKTFTTCPFIRKIAKENQKWHGVIGF